MSSERQQSSAWGERAWVSLIGVAPLRAYTRVVGAMAGVSIPRRLRGALLGRLASSVGMDLDEAEHDLFEYSSFAELFVRRLKTTARQIDSASESVICPVDGCVSAVGRIEDGQLIQAKGISYELSDLLCDANLARALSGGEFATLYLRPKDYHRIHAPWSGRLVALRRVPGSLFPVQPAFVRNLKGLFVRNERVVLEFDTESGRCALVCVGAAAVGSVTTPFDKANIVSGRASPPIALNKGDEVGAFNLGSTVVLVFEPGSVALAALQEGDEVRVGQVIGRNVKL